MSALPVYHDSYTSVVNHLRAHHQILKKPFARAVYAQALTPDRSTPIIENFVSNYTIKKIQTGVDLVKFKRDMTIWISVSHQSFSVVEQPKFREALSPEAESLIPQSGNTVRKWILDEFQRQREILIDVFKKSKSRVHLSLDIWTTPSSNRAYLGIAAHWVFEHLTPHDTLIALPEMNGRHTGVLAGGSYV